MMIRPAPSSTGSRQETASLVTVMITTTPGIHMRRRDCARLAALMRQLDHSLEADGADRPDISPQLDRLRHAAKLAMYRPTRRSLALFVDADWHHTVTLPQPVFDRVVLDSHFDARDLLYAEQFHPPFRVLTVDDDTARLYESYEDTLVERAVFNELPSGSADRRTFRRLVVRRVLDIDAAEPRPFVVATADTTIVAHFANRLSTYVGKLGHRWANNSLPKLHRAARLHVSDWCAQRARAHIPDPSAPHWTHGSVDVQRAVAANPTGLLLVEANKYDRFQGAVTLVEPAEFGFRPTGLNAAIARVRAGGGRVRFVADGDLRHVDGVSYRSRAS